MFVYLKVWVQEHKKKKVRSTCKTFPTEGRSRTWTGLHRKLMIQMHSYGGKKWERPSDEWGDNWEEGKEETMLTAVSQVRPHDLHSKLLKSSFSDEWLMKYLLDPFTKSAKFTVFSWYKICFKSYNQHRSHHGRDQEKDASHEDRERQRNGPRWSMRAGSKGRKGKLEEKTNKFTKWNYSIDILLTVRILMAWCCILQTLFHGLWVFVGFFCLGMLRNRKLGLN